MKGDCGWKKKIYLVFIVVLFVIIYEINVLFFNKNNGIREYFDNNRKEII